MCLIDNIIVIIYKHTHKTKQIAKKKKKLSNEN